MLSSWQRSLATMAVLALVPSWVGLAGGWFWLFDVFANFRWQYLIVSVVVCALAAACRRRRLLALAGPTLLLNALLIGQLAWHPRVSTAALANDFSLRVVSLNVHTSNPDKQAVLDYLLQSDADVVLLLEVDQAWIAALATLQASYPYQLSEPRSDNFGIALFSRVPWQQAGVIKLGDGTRPSVEMRMAHQGRELVIIGTHPLPPAGSDWARSRDAQLAALADHVQQISAPVLVVGDFNATPWSTGMRRATSGTLGFRSLAAPWNPTWEVRSIFAIPIDHALCTAPLVITSRSVGPDVGSDHRPLEIVLGLQSPVR
jgi:endonuclease/exonuclease/phosphatase (EEP) superfamily protein YafD